MKEHNATVLATGHHGDDNVETLLMRLSSQSERPSSFTAMRRCRRWGMTLEDEKISGMHYWIVRPLLVVPKVS
jgi:tRNA(Ile)-lysidine synthase TilS/MesJ